MDGGAGPSFATARHIKTVPGRATGPGWTMTQPQGVAIPGHTRRVHLKWIQRKKNNNSHEEEEEDKLETINEEMSYLEWKAWHRKKKLQNMKKKSNTKNVIESSDESDTNYKRRSSRSSNKGNPSRAKGKANYRCWRLPASPPGKQ